MFGRPLDRQADERRVDAPEGRRGTPRRDSVGSDVEVNDGLTARIMGICGTKETLKARRPASPRVTSISGVQPGSRSSASALIFSCRARGRTTRAILAERPARSTEISSARPETMSALEPLQRHIAERRHGATSTRQKSSSPAASNLTTQLSRARATLPVMQGSRQRAGARPSAESPRDTPGCRTAGCSPRPRSASEAASSSCHSLSPSAVYRNGPRRSGGQAKMLRQLKLPQLYFYMTFVWRLRTALRSQRQICPRRRWRNRGG